MPSSALAGLALLVIGESHLSFPDSLMNPLYDNLTQQGAAVHMIGACGAGAADWVTPRAKLDCGAIREPGKPAEYKAPGLMATQPIRELIAKDKPDLIVLILGDTMASYPSPQFPKVWVWSSVTSLTKEIRASGVKCVWVGPPWGKVGSQYKKDDTRTRVMSQFLATNVAPCTYVDSLTFSKPGEWITTDGQHFTIAGYRAWAAAIGKSLGQLPGNSVAAQGAKP